MREECREDRRLGYVLTRVRGEVLRTLLSRDAVVSQPVVRTTVGAEDGVRNLLAAVVACHRLDPPGTGIPRAPLSVANGV
jgi:hypothetical protein